MEAGRSAESGVSDAGGGKAAGGAQAAGALRRGAGAAARVSDELSFARPAQPRLPHRTGARGTGRRQRAGARRAAPHSDSAGAGQAARGADDGSPAGAAPGSRARSATWFTSIPAAWPCIVATSADSRRASSTGTARPATAGRPILLAAARSASWPHDRRRLACDRSSRLSGRRAGAGAGGALVACSVPTQGGQGAVHRGGPEAGRHARAARLRGVPRPEVPRHPQHRRASVQGGSRRWACGCSTFMHWGGAPC